MSASSSAAEGGQDVADLVLDDGDVAQPLTLSGCSPSSFSLIARLRRKCSSASACEPSLASTDPICPVMIAVSRCHSRLSGSEAVKVAMMLKALR